MSELKIKDRYSNPDVRTETRKPIPEKIAELIDSCAVGDYQLSLLTGYHAWSGSSLKGAARQWAAKYAASRKALLNRINESIPPNYYAEPVLVFDEGRKRWVLQMVVEGPDCMDVHGAY